MKPPSKSQILYLIKDVAERQAGYENWVSTEIALRGVGCASNASLLAAAATIAHETARTFHPISEFGDAEYFHRMYGHRSDYELDSAGLWRWRGRGLVQLTGKYNYQEAGKALNLDLANHPELACQMPQAARIFAWFWSGRHINKIADSRKWEAVRRAVNGGTNGLDQFMRYVKYLGGC